MLATALTVFALFCTSVATPQTVANETDKIPVVDTLPSEDTVTFLPGTDVNMDVGVAIDDAGENDDDDETTTPTQETSTDTPEALPVAQPLIMDVSVDDVDYMTMLRPPPPPMPPPGPRSGPKGRKKKQKRRRPVSQGSGQKGPMNRGPLNPVQIPVNNVREVYYYRGYPDYAADEQRKSRDRTQEELPLEHVDELPYAFESIMSHVASLGEPHNPNHKSFGVDAPPSDTFADNSQHLTTITEPPPAQHNPNQPYELPVHQTPVQHTDYTPHSQHSPQSHDPYQSATVQVTRSIPLGEHHTSASGDWLIGFNPSSTFPVLPASKSVNENIIESQSPPYSNDVMPSIHFKPTSPNSPISYPTIQTTTTSAPSTVEPSAKRATLRDILSTDCPDAEDLGYCDSPPRYPTQQVNAVLRECADLVDLLHAPLPEAPGDDSSSLPGEEPACPSSRQILRPGYVRDAASGRWYVAVQSRGLISQRIPSEKCTAAGKSCAGLTESKCARNVGFRNGVRASVCRQKWTMRSVLTWDPDRPTRCPQMTMVKLPDTCVCRLLPSGSNETTNKLDR